MQYIAFAIYRDTKRSTLIRTPKNEGICSKQASFRWPGEDALHRLQELGKPGSQDEVVIAALRAAQAVMVGGEEKGRQSCLDWIQQFAGEGNGEVSNEHFVSLSLFNISSRSVLWQGMLQLWWVW